MGVPRIERDVGVDDAHGRADRLTDGARFGSHVVLEAASQPQAGCFLKNHESEALGHGPERSNRLDAPSPAVSIREPSTYVFAAGSAVAIPNGRSYTVRAYSLAILRTSGRGYGHGR